jgi:asparagine synthase (glutamine-hydrolysing)
LLSRESLQRSSYFDADRVLRLSDRLQHGPAADPFRIFYGVALWAVVGTQLWHHPYLGGGLCELPAWTWTAPDAADARAA